MAILEIDRTQVLGNIPPREMFDRALTLLSGRVISGTIRVCDQMELIREDGTTRRAMVYGMEDRMTSKTCHEVTAGQGVNLVTRGQIRGIACPARVCVEGRPEPGESSA